MFKKSAPVLILGILLLAMPIAGMSQSAKGAEKGTTTVPVGGGKGPVTIESLITRYTPVAGSDANAKSLVNGLRDGTEVVLTATVRVQKTCQDPSYTVTDKVPIYLINPITKKPQLGANGQPIIIGYSEQTRTVTPAPYDCSYDEVQRESFTPPTGNMGLGIVDIALAFTSAQLVELDLGSPTPGQLRAALMGGDVQYGSTTPKSTKTLPGILTLRASGKGWSQIAADLGYKLQ